jgi:hypothetical protein
MYPLTTAISRFIQMSVPLPPLKLMAQSQHPVRVVPPPHAAIEPSALRAAKAKLFE